MGQVVVVAGLGACMFVATPKGFQLRYQIVIVFVVLFLGTIAYQVHHLDQMTFDEPNVFMLAK